MSDEFAKNYDITKTEQCITKPRAYYVGNITSRNDITLVWYETEIIL